jgi:hypothetical protein
MREIKDEIIIEQTQKLLGQHRRNLCYLQQQAANYGHHVPLEIHNALTVEQGSISQLERELAGWGVSCRSQSNWQALVIDNDSCWRRIIINHINQLGGEAIEGQTVSASDQEQTVADCAVAIVGVTPAIEHDPVIKEWIKAVVKLRYNLPLILLASWEDRDTLIDLRQKLRQHNINVTPTTIFKETFDITWFARVVHQLLIC